MHQESLRWVDWNPTFPDHGCLSGRCRFHHWWGCRPRQPDFSYSRGGFSATLHIRWKISFAFLLEQLHLFLCEWKKKDFPCFLISWANMMSFSVNRLLAKIRYVWYLSSCTFWRYVIMNFKKTEGFSWSGERLKRYEYEWNSLGITGSFRRWKWKCIKDRCYNHEASSAYSLNLSSLFSVIRKGEFRWKATKNCSLKDFIAAVTGKWNI